jgi:hypothetical protein
MKYDLLLKPDVAININLIFVVMEIDMCVYSLIVRKYNLCFSVLSQKRFFYNELDTNDSYGF